MYPFEKTQSEIKSPSRYTIDEWYYNNRKQYQTTENRGIHAENLIEQSDRIRDRVKEITDKKKKETDWSFQKRIKDIEFVRVELEKVRTSVQVELEALGLLEERIKDEIKYVSTNAEDIVNNCIKLREGRSGIDLIHDEVERELEKEIKKIKECEVLLHKTLEQAKESKRDLRSSLFMLNKDVENKLTCLAIETECLNLKETYSDLHIYQGNKTLDNANITVQEWARYSEEIMKSCEKKIKAARQFESHVKSILEEVITDLREQYFAVNEAFQWRILELKEAKARLETQHYEIARQVNDMTRNLAELEKSIREKEGFLALAQTRLQKRATRPNTELVRDEVETSLVEEILEIKNSVLQLQKMYSEGQISLRYLLRVQMDLEEGINIKTNSIKIDEVDCLTLRQGINYHSF